MLTKKNISVTAIVPVFNEDKLLEHSVKRLISENIVDKIIIVNDCSTDNSKSIMEGLCNVYEFIDFYETSENLGKGGAVRTIKEKIQTDYVIIHDADLEYFPKDIEKLISKVSFDEPTFVIGSRFINNSKPQNYIRTYVANKLLSKIFSIKKKINVTDIASCYKLFPTSFFKNTDFISNGFEFEVEIVAKYLNNHSNLHECGIDYKSRTYSEGKKIKFSDFFKYIIAIIKF